MPGQGNITSAVSSEAYSRTALDRACGAIVAAQKGWQETTLHREAYAIGGLVAGGAIKEREARARLIEAAQRMPAYGDRWTGLERKVEVIPGARHGKPQEARGRPRAGVKSAKRKAASAEL